MLRILQRENNPADSLRTIARNVCRPAGLAAIMFLMMRAELLLRASPMAAAMMAAALACGENAAPLAAGCLLGLIRIPLMNCTLLPAISCVLILAAELVLGLLPLKLKWSVQTRASLISGLSALLPALIWAAGDIRNSLCALICGLLAAACAPFIVCAMRLQPGRKQFSLQEKTGAALMICGCIAGLSHIFPPLADILSMLIVLLLPGTSTGALCGLALCAGGAGLIKTASLALCALASGGKFFQIRWQRALAAVIAAVLAQVLAGPGALDFRWAVCAAALYMLLPGALVQRAAELVNPYGKSACDPDRIAREVSMDTRRRLQALSDAFSVMAEGCGAPCEVPDEQELICEMRSRLCAGCVSYENCWAGGDNRAVHLLCRMIADALDRTDAPPGMRVLFSDGEIPPDVLRICRRGRMIPDRLGLLLRDFAEKRRSEIKRCTNNQLLCAQLMQAQEILLDMAGSAAPQTNYAQLHAALENAGLGDCEAVCCVNGGISLLRADSWNKKDALRAAAALSPCIRGRLLPRPDGDTLRLVPAPRLSADTGTSCQSGIAGEICGDSHLVRILGENRLMLVISDGMGAGTAAAQESQQALRLLWRFLDAGISRPLALETVNRQLLMGSGEDIFATLDLCIIDLNSGIAEFTKLAACRTLILRGRELVRVEGGRLPLGILEHVQPNVSRIRLRPGDMLVMGSDGVMEAGDPLMIERLARGGTLTPPDQLAEQIVRHAGLCRAEGRMDDLTCICVRIQDAQAG